jgi:hypothetical protein
MSGFKNSVRTVALVGVLCVAMLLPNAVGQTAEPVPLGPFTLILSQCESYTLYRSSSAPSDVTLVITVVELETQSIENIKVDVDGPEEGPDVDLNESRFLHQAYPAVVRVRASSIAIATEANCDSPDTAHIEVSLVEH